MAVKLSVIVPIYNAERFLYKSLESIVKQTLKNLEIVLINDGSTDRSGDICDKFSDRDNRIKVLHKENKGVSHARNEGIRIATGEFIAFVDADDWMDEDLFMTLINLCENNDADISICRHYDVIRERAYFLSDYDNSIYIYENIDAIQLLINDSWLRAPWGKVYKKNIFDDVVFPYGKILAEDSAIMHEILFKSRKVVLLNSPKYYYRYRDNWFFNFKMSLKGAKDNMYSCKKRIEFCINRCQVLKYEAIEEYILMALSCYYLIDTKNGEIDKVRYFRSKLIKMIKIYYNALNKNKKCKSNIEYKMMIFNNVYLRYLFSLFANSLYIIKNLLHFCILNLRKDYKIIDINSNEF